VCMTTSAPSCGIIEAVRGSVVDARFPGHIPAIFHVLKAGEGGKVIVEVSAHLDSHTVRGIALTPTRGLSRGTSVVDTGQPLKAPVGEHVLGRMLNVFGEAIDKKGPSHVVEWDSIHASPVSLMRRATSSEVFVTGIKAIDVLAPLERVERRVYSAAPASARRC
jgi:F-type H+-transporting ATPase subunit beta